MVKETVKDGYKKCTLCKKILKESSDNFYHAPMGKNGLNSRCKECSNKLRKKRWHNKTSHKVPCRCHYCGRFFYEARSIINRMERRQKTNNPRLYCNQHCYILENGEPRSKGMKGKTWNGARRGENNPNARLTEKEVKLIKKALKDGLTNKEICEKFNQIPSTISQIKMGKRWAHVIM